MTHWTHTKKCICEGVEIRCLLWRQISCTFWLILKRVLFSAHYIFSTKELIFRLKSKSWSISKRQAVLSLCLWCWFNFYRNASGLRFHLPFLMLGVIWFLRVFQHEAHYAKHLLEAGKMHGVMYLYIFIFTQNSNQLPTIIPTPPPTRFPCRGQGIFSRFIFIFYGTSIRIAKSVIRRQKFKLKFRKGFFYFFKNYIIMFYIIYLFLIKIFHPTLLSLSHNYT